MIPTSRFSLFLITAATVLTAAWTLGAGPTAPIGHDFIDSWDDDPVGAMPWGLATPGTPVIKTPKGSLVTVGPIDPRASVVVTAVSGPNGPNHVLRLSDANILDGTAHSEVTVLPFGAIGDVMLRFELRPLILTGDAIQLTVVDNRTTPGTGRLILVTIRNDGVLTVNDEPTSFVLSAGKLYRFSLGFDLTGTSDTASVHVMAADGSQSIALDGLPIDVDAAMVTGAKFALSNGGNGAFDLDEVRVFHSF